MRRLASVLRTSPTPAAVPFARHAWSLERPSQWSLASALKRAAPEVSPAKRRPLSTLEKKMEQSQEVLRLNYLAPPFRADHVDLEFDLDEVTTVKSKVKYVRVRSGEDLVLNGEKKPSCMKLLAVRVDGKMLANEQFELDDVSLKIPHQVLGDAGSNVVEVDVTIEPAKNTSLSGLYKSGGIFCTQCEAEGFRNITYAIDRPDNMSKYTTKVIGHKDALPYLLSNGNDVERGELPNGKHFVLWEDPWPKPSYLFALVAGDLAVRRDVFKTCSGKDVRLSIFVEKGNESKTEHAMSSLKKSFKWDEERFDREYDLDQFNIVAVSHFNMGAMENKSLNIFNDRCILADSSTATDADFTRIEGIIGHEYFHNWSGNRVTCQDWFQLTLKEGLTVFRDQEFTSDLNSRVAKRIEDVRLLRDSQYPEDASPMSHPIRPDSYISIDNFYTATVYEKGAEVIRMIYTIVGRDGFRQGLNLYFERHDGQAVTCDHFVAAMEDANNVDLTQFKETWYAQSGTPVLSVSTVYDEGAKTFTFSVKQSCPPTPGQPNKKPFDIPFAVGLIGSQSKNPIPVKLAPESEGEDTVVLRVTEQEQTFVLYDVQEKPVPSMLRGFSAPVKLNCDLSRNDLMFLAGHDTDEFVRYDSLQALAKQILTDIAEKRGREDLPLLITSLENTLKNKSLDKAVVALSLSLPDEHSLFDECAEGTADIDGIVQACSIVGKEIAESLGSILLEVYNENETASPEESDGDAVGRRALKNACLKAMMKGTKNEGAKKLALAQFESSEGMTERYGALLALKDTECTERTKALEKFYQLFKDDHLVMTKWLSAQARSSIPSTLENVKSLLSHHAFEITNPNKCYSLLGGFAANFACFHDRDGEAYKFFVDQIIKLDKINPQVAARLSKNLTNWRTLVAPWNGQVKQELERIARESDLSPDVYEIIHKSLHPPASTL